jgi:hypothetical protein
MERIANLLNRTPGINLQPICRCHGEASRAFGSRFAQGNTKLEARGSVATARNILEEFERITNGLHNMIHEAGVKSDLLRSLVDLTEDCRRDHVKSYTEHAEVARNGGVRKMVMAIAPGVDKRVARATDFEPCPICFDVRVCPDWVPCANPAVSRVVYACPGAGGKHWVCVYCFEEMFSRFYHTDTNTGDVDLLCPFCRHPVDDRLQHDKITIPTDSSGNSLWVVKEGSILEKHPNFNERCAQSKVVSGKRQRGPDLKEEPTEDTKRQKLLLTTMPAHEHLTHSS